jgi:hypothetical protein
MTFVDETKCIPLSASLDTSQRARYSAQARETRSD